MLQCGFAGSPENRVIETHMILPGIRGHENDQLVLSLVDGTFEVQRRLKAEGRVEAAGVVEGIDVVMNEEAGL